MVRREVLAGLAGPFDPALGSGGEDQDFFRRMMDRGHRFIWCNEAVVYEVVPPERWNRTYLFRRALLRGQNERHLLTLGSVFKSMLAVPVYALSLPFLLLIGQHLFIRFAIRLLDHLGKLLAAFGMRLVGEKYLS
jgi:cellulose synthase/poly-beta-1,6-N-acetylglucosamine synthase-like glycosyltransferase